MPVSRKRKKKAKPQKTPWEPKRIDVVKYLQETRKRQALEALESPYRLRELLEQAILDNDAHIVKEGVRQSWLDESNAEKQAKEADQPPSLWPTQGTTLPTQPTLWEVPSPPG